MTNQIVYSDPFSIKIDWSEQCADHALLQDPDPSNVPSWGGLVPWGSTAWSITHFTEFENDLCP